MSQSWIDSLLNSPRGHLFVRVSDDFIRENAANAAEFGSIDNYQDLLPIILSNDNQVNESLQNDAEKLYGIIHRYFLMTEKGRLLMMERQRQGDFPKCPRFLCHDFTCVPFGSSNECKRAEVHMFCPNCTDVYNYKISPTIDGAYFGPYWVHFLMNEHPEIAGDEEVESYTPHVFGFNVYLQPNAPPKNS